MMSKKTAQCSAADQEDRHQPASVSQVERPVTSPLERRNKPDKSSQRHREAASSSPDSGSLNGDGKRSGKMRHRNRKRLSNSESCPEVSVDRKAKNEEKPIKRPGRLRTLHAGLIGLQSECANVWFERSVYERAESLYQCWLASSSNRTSKSSRSPPAPGNPPKAPSTASSGSLCRHGDQVACHHVVETVWVNKTTFDQAECHFVEESLPSIPTSLDLLSQPNCSITPRTPDEGYQSLAPTPVIQQSAVTPTNRQPINGLPRIPVELLRDVWLEKPLYDRAEAAFYQKLYGSNSSKRSSCASTARSSDHPQSLVEEEEEEEDGEEVNGVALEEKRVVLQGKAEIFHALLPIQEEEEPVEVPEDEAPGGGVVSFVHPDSEPVWLDKWRYDAAENRFHVYKESKGPAKKGRRPAVASAVSAPPLRDKTMTSVGFLVQEKIWFDKPVFDEAERRFHEHMNGSSQPTQAVAGSNTILQDIARARENIQKSLAGLKNTLCSRGSGQPTLNHQPQLSCSGAADPEELVARIKSLELENQSLNKVVDDLRAALYKLESRVAVLEKCPVTLTPSLSVPTPPAPHADDAAVRQKCSTSAKEEDDVDDDFDLFGSDEDDEEVEKLKEERLKAYAEKKSKKPGVIAKSSILLDVKPWDDETDMAKLEECVRSVQADGLLWGTSKLVAVGYGIKKLQIACVVEDDKVGTDMLEEEITKFEEFVQSVDVAAFNKI